MSQMDEDAQTPHSVLLHHTNPIKNFQLKLGVIDFNYEFDHFFLGTGGLVDLIGEFNIWLKEDVFPMNLPKDPRNGYKIPNGLNKEAVERFKQIWYGHVYLHQKRNKRYEITDQTIIYDIPKRRLEWFEKIIRLPALMHMNPKSKTKDDTNPKVLIQEPIPFSLAYDGYDPDQLAQVFGFKYKFVDGELYMFKTDAEVMQSDALTMEISREVYHKLIRILIMEFKPYKDLVYNEINKVLRSYEFVQNLKQMEGISAEGEYTVQY